MKNRTIYGIYRKKESGNSSVNLSIHWKKEIMKKITLVGLLALALVSTACSHLDPIDVTPPDDFRVALSLSPFSLRQFNQGYSFRVGEKTATTPVQQPPDF